MAKNDSLFLLIKSLSKSEKRYFKLQSSIQGKQQNYLLLFESMEAMEAYDESKIKKIFKDNAFTRQLHVTKNYLNRLIMKSLRNFYRYDSVEAKLKSQLLNIEILFKRDLFKPCLKTIRKAENLARKYDQQLALLEILQWKRRIFLNIQDVDSSRNNVNEINELEKQSIEILKDLNQYWSMTINVADHFNQRDLPEFMGHDFLTSDAHATSYRSLILHYHLLYTGYTVSGEDQKAEASLDQLIAFLEENSHQIQEDPGPYITALNNKIGLFLNRKQLSSIPELLHKIRAIPEQYQLKNKGRITLKLLLRTYNIELEICRDTGKYEQGVNLIDSVRVFLEQYKDHVPAEYHVLFYYQFAYLHFMQAQFGKALLDINQILGQRYSGVRNDIMGYAQFLNLIIHFELGNITVLKYAVLATRRFLKKRGSLLEFEKVLLRFFSKISTKPKSEHGALFRALDQKLFGREPLLTENQLDYLDFKSWLSTKLKLGH